MTLSKSKMARHPLTGKWPALHIDPGVFPWLYLQWAAKHPLHKDYDLSMAHTKAGLNGLCQPVYKLDSEGRIWSCKTDNKPYIPVQALPAQLRHAYSIPGMVMLYADYVSCHLRIHLGGEVNYSKVEGYDQEEVKLAVAALLNGKSERNIDKGLLAAIQKAWPSLLECTRRRDWPSVSKSKQHKHYGSVLRKRESELLAWVLWERWQTDEGTYEWNMPDGIIPAIPMHDGIVWAVDPNKWTSPDQVVAEIKKAMCDTPWWELNGEPLTWPKSAVSVTWGPTWGDQSTDPDKWRPSSREVTYMPKRSSGRPNTLIQAGLLSIQKEYNIWIDPTPRSGVEAWAYCEQDRIHKIDRHLPRAMLRAASQYGAYGNRGWQDGIRPFAGFAEAVDGVVRWTDATTKNGLLVDDNTMSIRKVPWSYHAEIDEALAADCLLELEQYFPLGSAAVREFLRFTRAMLIGDHSHQKFLHLIGLPGHGKGTLMNIIAGLLPDDLVSRVPMHSFDPSGKQLSQLFGKMLNISDETRMVSGRAASAIQSLVAGDTVLANRLYRDSVPIKSVALISASNEPFGGQAYGMVNIEVRRKSTGKNDVEKFLSRYGQALVSLALAQTDQLFGRDEDTLAGAADPTSLRF